MVIVKHRNCKREKILEEYPDAVICDVTSRGEYKTLSPFYPHGGIPVPFSGTVTSACVEGIWQGLKVFGDKGVDLTLFANRSMKNLKRPSTKENPCLGHQKGLSSRELLEYIEARKLIYVPSYMWMLEHKCQDEIQMLLDILKQGKTLVLLDFNTNEDIEDSKKPLSHASLIKRYLEARLQGE